MWSEMVKVQVQYIRHSRELQWAELQQHRGLSLRPASAPCHLSAADFQSALTMNQFNSDTNFS